MKGTMYKPDPNQPKVEKVAPTQSNDNAKIVELENKLRQNNEQLMKLQAEFDKLNKMVRRQAGDINALFRKK